MIDLEEDKVIEKDLEDLEINKIDLPEDQEKKELEDLEKIMKKDLVEEKIEAMTEDKTEDMVIEDQEEKENKEVKEDLLSNGPKLVLLNLEMKIST